MSSKLRGIVDGLQSVFQTVTLPYGNMYDWMIEAMWRTGYPGKREELEEEFKRKSGTREEFVEECKRREKNRENRF